MNWTSDERRFYRHHERRYVHDVSRRRFRRIVKAVSTEFKCPPDRLLCTTRSKADDARARQVLYYMLVKHLGLSFTKVGSLTNRYRKTVSHGVQYVNMLRAGHTSWFSNRLNQIDYICKET